MVTTLVYAMQHQTYGSNRWCIASRGAGGGVMNQKRHKRWDCPCTDCQEWYRDENERLRAEAQAAREAEIDAESNRLEAMQANAEAAYMYAIQQRIKNNWVQPPTATSGLECVVNIRQFPGGEVASVTIGSCNGDSVVRRSIENAVRLASPLPAPADPSVFDRDIRLTFRPDE